MFKIKDDKDDKDNKDDKDDKCNYIFFFLIYKYINGQF